MAALRYLHQVGVVHRDLKPENVLMSEKMHIMIADFGSAQILPLESEDQPSTSARSSTADGTGDATNAATAPPATNKVCKRIFFSVDSVCCRKLFAEGYTP